MSTRAVLFDMDGVLVDSFEMWWHAMNDAARALGCPAISRAALADAFGQGLDDDLSTFFRGVSRADLEAAYARSLPRHAGRMRANPRAAEVLADLRRRGVARAVVTNTQDGAVGDVLDAVGLGDLFDVVVGLRAGLAQKPSPDLVHEALRRLGVPAAAALMVGDSDYDAGAARAAGVRYVAYDLRSGADLAAALAAALGHR